MVDYRRSRTPGATYFFTVNLRNRLFRRHDRVGAPLDTRSRRPQGTPLQYVAECSEAKSTCGNAVIGNIKSAMNQICEVMWITSTSIRWSTDMWKAWGNGPIRHFIVMCNQDCLNGVGEAKNWFARIAVLASNPGFRQAASRLHPGYLLGIKWTNPNSGIEAYKGLWPLIVRTSLNQLSPLFIWRVNRFRSSFGTYYWCCRRKIHYS